MNSTLILVFGQKYACRFTAPWGSQRFFATEQRVADGFAEKGFTAVSAVGLGSGKYDLTGIWSLPTQAAVLDDDRISDVRAV